MSVYRVNKTRDFTVMGNTHLRDKNLSLKAVGLLSKMLSFNDGWQFSTRGLATLCKEGPDAILSALKELEENGYLVRHRGRDDTIIWSKSICPTLQLCMTVTICRHNTEKMFLALSD